MLEQTSTVVTIASCLVAVLAGLVGWLRWARPRIHSGKRTWAAARDSIIGRDAIHDPASGRLVAAALPGIGVRMENVERAAVETNQTLKHVVELVKSQQIQDKRLDGHEDRIQQLETGAIERIATKAESISAWKAVAAVANQADPMAEDASVDEAELD